MNTYTEVDVFVGNHTMVDPEIYQLWLEGNTFQEAANTLQQRGGPAISLDLLLSDINDHYRTYAMLEKLLQFPPRLMDQWILQLDAYTQNMVISKYYGFDDTVMREILGKKLSSRQRKDLDEVSEKTNVNLKSCRRQFDNAKRIFKTVEELPGSLYHNVRSNFFLPDDLAKKYSAVVFIAENRFETNKRKLQYLTFQDFYQCAMSIMTHWKSPIEDEDEPADVEREFLMELTKFRSLLDKEKEHKTATCQKLRGKVCERIYTEVEQNFKVYSRTLINLAYGLNHNKELRDLFIDLVEKYIEPCKHLQWPLNDMRAFLEVYTEAGAGLQIDVFKTQPGLRTVWRRYMDGIAGCLIPMYHT